MGRNIVQAVDKKRKYSHCTLEIHQYASRWELFSLYEVATSTFS